MSEEVRRYASMMLRYHTVREDQPARGMPEYRDFTEGPRPEWLAAYDKPIEGEALGVYENCADSAEDAVLVTTSAVYVNRDGVLDRIRYSEIRHIPRLSKEPVSAEIVVELSKGASKSIPVRRPLGAAFTFLRFIMYARDAVRAV